MAAPDVTVALCSYNRAATLRESLLSLTELDAPDFTYEILLVDDASTDETRDVVEQIAQASPVPIRYVRETGRGVAAARNRCVYESSTEWLAYFDDDQIADPGWLCELLLLADAENARCVGGARYLRLDADAIRRLSPTVRLVLGEMIAGDQPHRFGRKPLLAAGSLLLHRSVFDRVGQFDESLVRGGEDLDLYRRIYSAGITGWFAPDSICHHIIPDYRLESEYLLWSSARVGENFAVRDSRQLGRAALAFACSARIGQSALVFVPGWIGSKVTRNAAAALGYRCRIWRTTAYVRHCLGMALPWLFSPERLRSRLEFRGERITFTEPSKSAR